MFTAIAAGGGGAHCSGQGFFELTDAVNWCVYHRYACFEVRKRPLSRIGKDSCACQIQSLASFALWWYFCVCDTSSTVLFVFIWFHVCRSVLCMFQEKRRIGNDSRWRCCSRWGWRWCRSRFQLRQGQWKRWYMGQQKGWQWRTWGKRRRNGHVSFIACTQQERKKERKNERKD